MATINLVFVHGWSVNNLDTYGELPIRLRNEGAAAGIDLTVQEIFLARYISFHDEVRVADISRAMQAAVQEQLAEILKKGGKFVCITHSTGGPVVRDWWERYYKDAGAPGAVASTCPMSHLIMLAPANFGSALAQLGKGRISRLASWMEHVEPGQGVLDWLELGSEESWQLNRSWILANSPGKGAGSFYSFVLIGESIDRKLYDHLNSYTGELGSDGVVRSAAANLNATLIEIRQEVSAQPGQPVQEQAPVINFHEVHDKPFRIITGKSHSGKEKGIMTSVKADTTDAASAETVNAILRCIQVKDDAAYDTLCQDFGKETDAVQAAEKLEIINDHFLALTRRYFIHDRFCLIIFRVKDSEGYPVTDYDLVFTVGDDQNPNHLPEGFFADRQQNSVHKETVTYFVNYDILTGSPAVMDGTKTVREASSGIDKLGLLLIPRPDKGFVRYVPLQVSADREFFQKMVRPNAPILIDICLQRLVSREVFRMEGPITEMPADGNFKDTDPGDACADGVR